MQLRVDTRGTLIELQFRSCANRYSGGGGIGVEEKVRSAVPYCCRRFHPYAARRALLAWNESPLHVQLGTTDCWSPPRSPQIKCSHWGQDVAVNRVHWRPMKITHQYKTVHTTATTDDSILCKPECRQPLSVCTLCSVKCD